MPDASDIRRYARPAAGTLSCLLRGEGCDWPFPDGREDVEALLFIARAHGVTPLLDDRFSQGVEAVGCPACFLTACHEDAVGGAMLELATLAEIPRVLAALSEAGIAALVLKGSALAYTHYPRSALRPRGDTDLLVPAEAVAQAAGVFATLGYVREPDAHGEAVSGQATWSRTDRAAVRHCVDLHWRASNRRSLARAFDYRELRAGAKGIPALGPDALGLRPAEALLFACAHRAAHVNTPTYLDDDAMTGGDRLIWLYDIHLLVSRMSPAELGELVELAGARKLKSITLDALRRTTACLATPVPADVLEELARPGPMEPSARYLTGRRARQLFGDFLELEDWPTRLRWLREMSFPDAAYLRRQYPSREDSWLPLLYLRRLVDGAGRVTRRRGAGPPRF